MKKLISIAMLLFLFAMMWVPSFAATQAQETDFQNVKFEIKKANVAWNADGVITDGEYYKVDTKLSWFSAAVNTDENLDYALKLNPAMYMSWDENYVYFATTYTVKNHSAAWDDDLGNMWQSGCLQMNYAAANETNAETRLEYGVGLSSTSGKLLTFDWADPLGTAYDAVASKDFIVKNNNNTLTYEVRTPWNVFLSSPKMAVGSAFSMCVVWSIGEGNDYIHTQLASGCTGFGKHAEYFAQVTLAAAPEVTTTAAPEVEAPATTTPPAAQTADTFSVIAVVAVIALAGAVIVSKKRG